MDPAHTHLGVGSGQTFRGKAYIAQGHLQSELAVLLGLGVVILG